MVKRCIVAHRPIQIYSKTDISFQLNERNNILFDKDFTTCTGFFLVTKKVVFERNLWFIAIGLGIRIVVN